LTSDYAESQETNGDDIIIDW